MLTLEVFQNPQMRAAIYRCTDSGSQILEIPVKLKVCENPVHVHTLEMHRDDQIQDISDYTH